MALKLLNPPDLAPPKGYSHGVASDPGGRVVCTAAQIGFDQSGKMVGDDMTSQFKQALKNVGSVLRGAGGHADSILRMTIFLTNKEEYLKNGENIGREYRAFMGKHSPAMTLVVVKDLLEPGAKISVEVTAVVNEKAGGAEFQRHGQGAMMPDAGLRGQGRPPPGPVKR